VTADTRERAAELMPAMKTGVTAAFEKAFAHLF
jgi:hypothetical protein